MSSACPSATDSAALSRSSPTCADPRPEPSFHAMMMQRDDPHAGHHLHCLRARAVSESDTHLIAVFVISIGIMLSRNTRGLWYRVIITDPLPLLPSTRALRLLQRAGQLPPPRDDGPHAPGHHRRVHPVGGGRVLRDRKRERERFSEPRGMDILILSELEDSSSRTIGSSLRHHGGVTWASRKLCVYARPNPRQTCHGRQSHVWHGLGRPCEELASLRALVLGTHVPQSLLSPDPAITERVSLRFSKILSAYIAIATAGG